MEGIEYVAMISGGDPSNYAEIVLNVQDEYASTYAEEMSWEDFIEEHVRYEYKLHPTFLDYLIDLGDGQS